MRTCVSDVDVVEMTVEESHALLDIAAKDALGVGREEFLSRLDAGEYDSQEREDIVRLKMLAPFGR